MVIKIALDAGHGIHTSGKQTPDGIKEWTLNDKVRDKVVYKLKDYDCEFIFMDNNEGEIDESLSNRLNKYVNSGAAAMVSIHHNANTGDWNKATGVEIFTDRSPTGKDNQLAKLIYSKLVKYTGLRGRGIQQKDFYVINQDRIPAVLVEGGFMDGVNDYKVITTNAGQEAYANAVAEGLIEFLNLKKKTATKPIAKPTVSTVKEDYEYMKTVKKGSKGTCVKIWQAIVGVTVDGDFGKNTEAKTIAWQKKYKLDPDGCVGPKTWAKAFSLL